jgi:hypothetical protein
VIVQAGDDLQLRGVLEQDAAHHVHLPQLHRTLPLEAAELVATLATSSQLDQLVALQATVDGGARRNRVHAGPGELVLDPAGTPARVLASQLADQGLDLGGGLVRAGGGAV